MGAGVRGGPTLPSVSDAARWMREALGEAELAGTAGELPVGAVVVLDGVVVARGHPRRIRDHNPVAHAETQALAAGGERLWAHPERAVLFTTLEPCPMCLGAAVIAGVAHIVFALPDAAAFSGMTVRENPYVRHHIRTHRGGLLADEARAIMAQYTPAMLHKIANPSVRPWYQAADTAPGPGTAPPAT